MNLCRILIFISAMGFSTSVLATVAKKSAKGAHGAAPARPTEMGGSTGNEEVDMNEDVDGQDGSTLGENELGDDIDINTNLIVDENTPMQQEQQKAQKKVGGEIPIPPDETGAEAFFMPKAQQEDRLAEELQQIVRPEVKLVEISPYDEGAFRDRRPSWTTLVTLGAFQYAPKDYKPNFVTTKTFSEYYSAALMYELGISFKKNFSWVAFALDMSVGSYKTSAADGSELTVLPGRVGLGVAFDTIFPEPYVVPYVVGGTYIAAYKESIASSAVNGNTPAAAWYGGGLRLQMDWVDELGDEASYRENGMENTFLYFEGRTFAYPGGVPNLGTPADQPIQYAGGISFEF